MGVGGRGGSLMARRSPGTPSRHARVTGHPAVRGARKAWPLILAAKQRWDALTPEQQERYRRMASEYAQRGRQTLRRRPPR
jgi:TRAP-type C4-dicarboxylate transport system substrate-binding protein